MNEQLLKDFIATAQKYNYNWNKAFGLFPELKGYDQQLLKDYVATAEKNNYDYKKVNSLFPELGFNQEPVKKKESTVSASKLAQPTSGSSTKQDDFYKGGLGESKSTKKTEPKKQASMSYEFKTYTGYPGKEKNEYRVSDGNWVRRQPGEKNWVTITNEGSINALNNQFNQNIKPFESKDDVSKVKDYNNLNKQFQQNLSFVNSKLVDKSEEEVVPKLQRLFPAFTFEQSRAGADRVMVTAPNGKKEEFLLDNYTWSSDKAEADRLKGWMSGNYDAKVAKEEAELRRVEKTAEDKVERTVLPGGGSVTTVTPSFVDRDTAFPIIEEQAKKERADYYKAKSEQVKEIYDKYSNSKSGVKDFEATQAFAELKADDAEIKRLNAYQDDIKMDIQDYASKKQKAATYLNEADGKLRRGEITQEQYDLQYKPQIEEMEAELKDQQSRIQSQTGNIDLVKKAAERAAAENYIIQESKGSFGGGLAFSAVKGMTALPRLALGIMGIESKDLADQMAKDLGLFTTREYIQSENRADLAKAAFSLTESLVAMQSGGPALGGLALYGMGYYELKDELDQVEGMTEQEKMIMAGAYGIVSAALERFGIESAVGKISSSTGKSLKMGIMKEVFSSLPKNASKEVIEAAVINSTKKYLTSAGLNIVGGAVVEGTTEALQSLSSAGIKELYDLGKETDYFNNEGASKVFEDALYEGYLGALGGTIMSGVYNTAQVGVRELKANSNELKLLMQAAETEGMDSAVLASVKADMLSGKITKEQAKTIVDNFQDVKSKVDQMPDGISTDGKSVALSLMTERDELNKQIAGKDPNLVKPQTDRISEINNSLQQIPIDYAVQEQGADAVPVQSGAGVSTEMEKGVSEAKPEGVTGETITEEVEVEGPKAEQPKAEVAQEIVQSEENQALIDDYVQRQTRFINEVYGDRNEEAKQEVLNELTSDPIAYAEKRKERESSFNFLNSLQRQPAAQEAAVVEEQAPITQETATTEKLTVNPSEGYSFEYESENDIPAELKGVEPTGRTETKVGRGKNAKTKLKLTFTGQQLIDAGLAATPEAQAEVVQETVQPTAQAQPTAKIETIEVKEVPQVEQTLNDLTQQNNVLTQNDFTAARIRNAGKEKVVAQIQKAAKAIAKVLPKVKIVVHATPEAFVDATKDMDGRLSEGGLYDQQTGEIHINLEIANNRTVAHEVFHALILSMVKSDVETQRLTRSMIGAVRKSLKKAEGTAELMSYLEDFENNYDENIKNEEKLAELFAILADNYKELPPASKNVIIRFLNRLAKALGLKEMTDREAIAFMNTLSRKVETGQEIEAREVGKQKEGKAAVRKQIIGEVGAKKLDQQENSNLRMKNLKVANDMKDAGKTPKEIRTATGWEMGAEGKWRYETVDNLPFFKDTVRAIKEMQAENNLTFLNNVPANLVIPQELIKMYPELNDYTVDFGTGNENEGNVNFDKKRIEVNIGLYPKNTVSTLLHEIQHVIQEIEGFDSGTNTQEIIDEFLAQDNALKRRINMLKKYSPDSPLLDAARNNRKAFIDNFSTVNKNNERVLDKFNLYMRKAGEIEARNVEARMNMTAEERRNTLLTETEDIKDRQIIETAPRKFAVRKQKADVVKSKINEDYDHVITLNGKEIGKIFYDKSQKTWNNSDFDRRGVKPNTYQWVYGDIVGENKQEAINEMVRRYKEKEAKPTPKTEEEKIKYTNDQVTNSFLNALNEKSNVSKNTIDNKSFIYGDKASLELSRFDKGDRNEIAIQSISTFDKGKGVGKQVMKDITDTADELGVTLTLDAKPFGNEGLSKEQLINFYKKNGFVADIKEMFGGEFESEQELIDYVVNEEPEVALQMTREPSERQFAVRKQKTTGPDKIVNDGTKAGKTDAEIRQEGKAAGFTNKEMTEALSKYYTKEQKVFMKSGVKGLVGRFVDGARRFKQQFLTSKGLLPKIGFTYKEKMEGEISAESNRAAKTAKKFGILFDKFTGDKDLLLKAFDKALRGDKSIQLPAGFAALANEMRNHIDRLSQMLIATGAVEGDMADTIRDNMGTYITRSYEIFDNKNFRQKVGEQELQAAKNFLRTQPGMIALAQAEATRTGTTVDEALDVLVDNKIDEYFADAETGALVKGSKLGSKDLSTLKERKEIPEQIRMLMGEYSDPAMNYARTVLNIASLAARHQFLTQVKEAGMGKFFFEKNDSQRPKGFDTEIASEGSDTMSPLNGLMTTPEIAEAFGLYNGQQGEESWAQQAIKIYYKAMGLVKWLKTIGSISTHAKNIFSNFTFVGVNGHSLIEIGKAIKVVAQDLKTMSKPEVEAKIDEYIKAGIMRQGAGINEIRDMFKDADMDGFLERRLSMKKRKGVMGKIRQAISSRSSKIVAAMEDAYQAEDDMFKIAAYETEMNRYADALYNKSKDQLTDKERQEVSDIAANNVKNTYPTYSRIPEGIKRLRRFPLFIGSFISFQAESYRTAYNTIALAKDELSSKNKKIKGIGARRVAGASAYLTAKTAILSYLGYAAGTGIGGVLGALFDDDDEKKKEKDVRGFLPSWSQNSDLIILKAADGEIEYIDFSASDAHGGINKALNAFLKGDDLLDSFKQSTLELVGQFQGPDILTNLAIQLKGNENDFGKPIYNEEDSFAEKTDKILDYVYKVVEPGTITSIRKAAASEQSLGQIAFGDATGLKVRKSDVKEQFGYKLAEFDESFKDIRKIYNSEYYKSLEMYEDPKATKKDIKDQNTKTDEALVRANEKYASKAKELMDLINSANRLGVDYDELINELGFIKSTMGKSNISEMENGGDEFIKEKEY